MTANVMCIKWGTKFPAYYVNRLYRGVARALDRPFRFICVTEHPEGIIPEVEVLPLPDEPFEAPMVTAMTTGRRRGAWRKISLFRAGLADIDGPVLGFDLDVVITGPLADLFDHAPGKVCMARDWLEERRHRPGGHGSVFRFDPARHGYLYDDFAAAPEDRVAWANGSEQKYTSMTALGRGDLEYYPPAWIKSFKRHAMQPFPLNLVRAPALPPDARVVCFHGTPKMEEALAGYRGKWYRTTKPAPWLERYWVEGGGD